MLSGTRAIRMVVVVRRLPCLRVPPARSSAASTSPYHNCSSILFWWVLATARGTCCCCAACPHRLSQHSLAGRVLLPLCGRQQRLASIPPSPACWRITRRHTLSALREKDSNIPLFAPRAHTARCLTGTWRGANICGKKKRRNGLLTLQRALHAKRLQLRQAGTRHGALLSSYWRTHGDGVFSQAARGTPLNRASAGDHARTLTPPAPHALKPPHCRTAHACTL